jgi:hypothetical protein
MYFQQVIFTDETTVEIDVKKSTLVRRSFDETIKEIHCQSRRAFSRKIMFWGCISVFGTGSLVAVEGSINSQRYVEILKSHLLPIAKAWYGDEHWILVQDNAPCHSSQLTRRFLDETNIHVLPWPSNSPDMNIIENIWHLLKLRLYRKGSGKTCNEVILSAKEIWENDDDLRQACLNAVKSMQNRLKTLYNARGSVTKY